MRNTRRLESWWSLAILLILSYGILYPGLLIGTKTFFARDYGVFGYALACYGKASWLHGQVPLWNPYISLGTPFAAQWAPMVFYPGTLIYMMLPTCWGLSLFMLLHIVAAGIGMQKLLHRLTNSDTGAFFAGYTFGLSGITLSLLLWPHACAALAYMPWVLWVCHSLFSEPKLKWLVVATGLSGMQLLTGMPEIILFTWMILAALLFSERVIAWRSLLMVGLVPPFAVLLAAIQMAPFFQLWLNSTRISHGIGTQWACSWSNLINIVAPLFHYALRGYGIWCSESQEWIGSYYVPVGLTYLAFLCAMGGQSRRTWAFWLVAIGAVFLSFGLSTKLPVLSGIRYPIKFILVSVWCICIIAWQGFGRRITRRELITYCIICTALTLSILFDHHASAHKAAANFAIRAVLGLGLLLLLRQSKPNAMLLALMVFLDIATHVPEMNPVVDVGSLQNVKMFNPVPALGEGRFCQDRRWRNLRAKLTDDCALNIPSQVQICSPNLNLLASASSVHGFTPLSLTDSSILEFLLVDSTNTVGNPERLLDFLGVKYAPDPGKVGYWKERGTEMPFVTVGQAPLYGRIPSTQFFQVDFTKTVLIRDTNAVGLGADPSAVVQNFRVKEHEVEANVTTAKATQVVVAQSWYPCWEATVNGKPAPIYRANSACQAIPVPAGRSQVRLQYNDRWFKAGAWISLVSWFLWSIGGVVVLRRAHAPAANPIAC